MAEVNFITVFCRSKKSFKAICSAQGEVCPEVVKYCGSAELFVYLLLLDMLFLIKFYFYGDNTE